MKITRRAAAIGAFATTTLPVSLLARPALAQSAPIKIGIPAAMTGPSSAPSIGFDRGVRFAVESINAAGGVKGRKVEITVRDTQGDPTKAVNATQELISQVKVDAMWGPFNSGEALATTAIMARAKMPDIHPCVVDSLIDPKKFPNAFRLAPSNGQWDDAVRGYTEKVVKAKKVAVIGDTTGYGVTAAKASSEAFKKDGVDVVYLGNIDSTQPDLTPDMLRMRNAGAEAIIVWSVATGMIARMFNTRDTMGWDVPFVGHPAMSAGDIGGLLTKPSNWEKVYVVGYKSCSYDAQGKYLPRTQELLDRIKGKINLSDSLLWWVASGVDAIELIAKAVEATGESTSAAITGHWNSLTKYPGYFGTYTFTPEQHNGYPTDEVVMSAANTAKNGAFALAPGTG